MDVKQEIPAALTQIERHAVERFSLQTEGTYKCPLYRLHIFHFPLFYICLLIFRMQAHHRRPIAQQNIDTKGCVACHCLLHRILESLQLDILRQFTAHRNIVHGGIRVVNALQIDAHLGIRQRILFPLTVCLTNT